MSQETVAIHREVQEQEIEAKEEQQARNGRLLRSSAWWAFFLVCAVFGVYALYMGSLELAARLGFAPDAPQRAVSLAFIIHAFTGGVALIAGALQFDRSLLAKRRTLHRLLGHVYVGSIWIASVTGLWSAIFFAESFAGQIAFGLVAVLWFATTTLGFVRARARNLKAHRAWMMRSFALSLFFVTFPFWTEALSGTNLPEGLGYPLGVFLGWSVNLLVAEALIRRSRRHPILKSQPAG